METLVQRGCDAAMKAAALYCRRGGRQPDADVLIAELRAACRDAAGLALADAREALECGMVQVAEQTYLATFRLAGIKAAERALELTLTAEV
jgi:hypothetical protein